MAKAKPHPDQFGFSFVAPLPATLPGSLAGLERQISGAVGTILNSDLRPREVIAAEMSVLLGEDVTAAMLNAYASPAREGHKVIMSRFWALVQVTTRQDVLDQLLRSIGVSALIGEETMTARLGQLQLIVDEANREIKQLKGSAPLIRGGKTE